MQNQENGTNTPQGATEALNRLRIGLGIAMQQQFSEISDCCLGTAAIPEMVDPVRSSSGALHRCTSMFFAGSELIRIFEDPFTAEFFVLIRDKKGNAVGLSYPRDECEEMVRASLAASTPASTSKNRSLLSLLHAICGSTTLRLGQ